MSRTDGSLIFDTKVDQTGFSNGINKLKSTAMGAISAIGAAFATGAIAKALLDQIKLVEQYGSTINDQSQKIGISIKAYQELSYIMGQTGGSVDTLQMGIKTLSSAVVDGNKAFETLGISLDDARAMSQEDLFNTVITQLASMESGTLRTSLATDLFGRSASELAPLLNLGADGIAKMREEAANYGLIMTDKAVEATDKYGDATALAQKAAEALRNAMIGRLMPALTNIALGFADIAKESTTAFNERGIKGVIDVITDRFPVATAVVSGLVAAFTALLVIQTLTKIVVALQTAQVQLALAMMGTTAAAVAESATLTLTEVIVGIFTGKLVGATAATALFNATIAANPVMALVIAIGVLVGGIVLLQKGYEKLHPEIYETRKQVDALKKSMDDSADAYDETTASIEQQQYTANGLIDTLSEMSAEYGGSATEQAKMQSICDSLNGSVDGLSVTFDANTGKLSQNAEAMRDVVAAQYEAAVASAALARYQELVTEKFNAKYALDKANAAYKASSSTFSAQTDPILGLALSDITTTSATYNKAKTAFTDASDALSEFDQYLADNGITLATTTDKTEELTETTDDLAEAEKRVVVAGFDVTDVLDKTGMTAEEAATRLDTFTGAATNMFEKINTKSKLTVKQMIANLTANATAIEEWGANIAYLGGKLPADLLQPLIDQGPENMAGVVKALAAATPEEFDALIKAFSDGGAAAREAWLISLGAGTTGETTTPTPTLGTSPVIKDKTLRDKAVTDAGTNLLTDAAEAVASDDSLNQAVVDSITSAKASMEAAVVDSDFAGVSASIVDTIIENLNGASQKFYDSGRRWSMNVIIGMLSRKAEIESDARSLALAANSAFDGALRLNAGTTTTTTVNADGSVTTKVARTGGAGDGILPQKATIIPFSARDSIINPATFAPVGSTTTINAPITVQGVVESDAKLSRRITKEFQGVVMYGRE